MARIGRLAGAILVESEGRYFLVGNPKEPLDLPAAGFSPPAEPVDAMARPWIELEARRPIALAAPILEVPLEGTAVAARIAQQLVIPRNGSVSDRLWRLIIGITGDLGDDEDEVPAVTDAAWLATVPDRVWSIVSGSVLRCS
jgi:hypothetical protein